MTGAALVVEDLHVTYGDVRALAGVDLEAAAGTTLGVLGHNGAGKTSLIRVLTTLLRPTGGRPRPCRPPGPHPDGGHGRVTEPGGGGVADALRDPPRGQPPNGMTTSRPRSP